MIEFARVIFISFLVTFLAFAPGIQQSVLNLIQDDIHSFINHTIYDRHQVILTATSYSLLWGVITCTWAAGAVIGLWISGALCAKIGRKWTALGVSTSLSIIGSLFYLFCRRAGSYEMIIVGRICNGLSLGIVVVALPVYLVEISVTKVRTVTLAFVPLCYGSWIAVGYLITLPSALGSDQLWNMAASFQGIFSVILLLISKWVPNSPQFLYSRGRQDEAMSVLSTLYGNDHDAITEELIEYQCEEADHKNVLAKNVFNEITVRRAIRIGLVLNLTNGFSGVQAMNAYGSTTMKQAGLYDVTTYVGIMAASFLIGAFLHPIMMQTFGRRRNLLLGFSVICAMNCLFLIIAGADQYGHTIDSKVSGYFSTLFMGFAALAGAALAGPACFTLPSELAEEYARPLITAVSTTTSWIGILVSLLVYPVLQLKIGAWAFLMFILPMVACLIYLGFKLPETHNRSIVDIIHELNDHQTERRPGTALLGNQNITYSSMHLTE